MGSGDRRLVSKRKKRKKQEQNHIVQRLWAKIKQDKKIHLGPRPGIDSVSLVSTLGPTTK
jgi:hypothetical protein